MIATALLTNVLLAVLGFNLLIAGFLWVLKVQEDRAIARRKAAEKLYVSPGWADDLGNEDWSSVRHGGLGR